MSQSLAWNLFGIMPECIGFVSTYVDFECPQLDAKICQFTLQLNKCRK